jgi:hypothetical protein
MTLPFGLRTQKIKKWRAGQVVMAPSSSVAESSTADGRSCETVVVCYWAVDRFFPACRLYDLTEGISHGHPGTSYEQAQANQHRYSLDQSDCQRNSRVLDIAWGCSR